LISIGKRLTSYDRRLIENFSPAEKRSKEPDLTRPFGIGEAGSAKSRPVLLVRYSKAQAQAPLLGYSLMPCRGFGAGFD